MSGITEVKDGIYWMGVNDRQTSLFENLWPLPNGIAYNAYIVEGDNGCALIDTVKSSFVEEYLRKIRHLCESGKEPSYLIINHMEPDHSGAIRPLRAVCPGIKIIGSPKTADMLKNFFGITEEVIQVKDGEELELGGRVLKFILTPMVHWPETMMTYDVRTGTLFSGDAFGGFGTLDGGIFDDEVNIEFYENEIRRYFTNIVGRFSPMVLKAVEKLKDIPILIVAPTHGPIWRENPGLIIGDYERWSRHETKKGVVIVYGSMYGNTEHMADIIARSLTERGMESVKIFNASANHVSYMINEIWRFRGLVLGTSTYNMGIFPPMVELVDKLMVSNLQHRRVGVFGTYAWSGGGVKKIRECAEKSGWELVEPVVEACCSPNLEDIEACRKLAANLCLALEDT